MTHIVSPTATALADTAAHHQHVDDAAVVHVAVVPVVHGRADDDHGLAFGLVGVVGKLACHGNDLVALDAGNLFLPGGGVGCVVVVTGGGVLAFNATGHAVVRHRQIEHGGDQRETLLTGLAQLDTPHRHLAHQNVVDGRTLFVGAEVGRVDAAEIGETDFADFIVGGHTTGRGFHQTQFELDVAIVAGFLVFQVPLAHIFAAFCAPTETDGAIRHHDLVGLVNRQRFPLGVVGLTELAIEVAGTQIGAGHQHRAAIGQLALFELHQVWHVGKAAHVVIEICTAFIKVKLFEDDVAHGHGDCGIRALLGVHPQIGELADLGVVGCDGHGLGALVAHLGEEVGIGRARLRHIRAPGNDEGGVVPVGRLRHIGLLAPDLRTCGRQIAIPVVKTHAHATDQGQVATAGGVADHAHGGDGREADDPVRAPLLGGVDIGTGDQLVHLVPGAAHKAAQAALPDPLAAGIVVFHNQGPGIHRVLGHGQRSTPLRQQAGANHRVFDAVGAVQIPGVRGATRAATGLVVGQVGTGTRVVGLLGFPGDDAALDVDLPRAGTGAVHAMGAAHNFVVRPAVAVGVFPGAVFTGGDAVPFRKTFCRCREMAQAVQKMAHGVLR